nr:ATP-binding protein [Pseudomonas sp.]
MNDARDTLDLIPDLSAVTQAVQWLERLGDRYGWPSRLQFTLTLSVDEALANIISHAFAKGGTSNASPYVSLRHRVDAHGVHIEIRDNGMAFDPTNISPASCPTSVETASIGGHGIRLMRHYLKALSYARQDDENRLTLTAELPAAESSD